ncbi:MAG: PQQ-dependent sugar dehydrogenase [Bacteroidia bacterium]|nr:PQQ-dependent sugar dehydrogenase [Bacteroidia bacterium]
MTKNLCLFLFSFFLLTGKAQIFSQSTVVANLTYPVAFTISPVDGRFFVTLKGHDASISNCDSSKIKLFDAQGNFLNTFFSLSGDSNFCYGETGILGICLDDDFTTNHYVYFYYNHGYAGDTAIRIIRLTDFNNVGINPTIILDIPTSFTSGIHVGGNVRCSSFFPGKIFVGIGELNNTANAQDLSKPYGKILRINTNGTIPTDNPFYDDGNPLTGNDDRIWTYGHRNPFDFCISKLNGNIYSSENGWNTWDELNLIVAGKNYGWPVCEGAYQWSSNSIPCATTGLTDPLSMWQAPLPAITGVEFYTGTNMPTLTNHLLVADNDYGNLYDCTMGNAPFYDTVIQRTLLADLTTLGGLTTVMQSPVDSCIYAMNGGFVPNGKIYRLCAPAIGFNENNFSDLSFEVFPNPAKEIVKIISEVPVSISVYDLSGRIVQSDLNKNNNHTINLSEIKSGIYFVKVVNEQRNYAVKKLIVE